MTQPDRSRLEIRIKTIKEVINFYIMKEKEYLERKINGDRAAHELVLYCQGVQNRLNKELDQCQKELLAFDAIRK